MVALSSTKAEYIAATEAIEATKEAMWLKGFVIQLFGQNNK